MKHNISNQTIQIWLKTAMIAAIIAEIIFYGNTVNYKRALQKN